MADSDFFTTGYRYALPALQPGPKGRPAWDYKPPASIPIQFKAKDKSLMKSLKRDTTLRISTPRAASTRKFKTQSVDHREFPPLPPPKVAYRKIELSPETQAVIDDVNSMPSEIPTLKHIIYQLRNERLKATAETDYEYGLKVQRAFVAAEKRLKWEIEHQTSYESLMKMVEQHHELETYVTGVLENFDSTFNEFMQVTEENLNKMYQQHEEELARFDEQEPQEPAARFRKRSPRLLAARDQERRYATHNKFGAAKKAQRAADAIEAAESSEAMRRTREDFLRKREQLIARQDATIEHFLQHAEETRLGIVNQRDRELSGYIRRLNALDRHIESGCAAKGVREEDVTDEERITARVERVRSVPDGERYPNTPGVTAFMRVRTPKEPAPNKSRPVRRAPQPVEERTPEEEEEEAPTPNEEEERSNHSDGEEENSDHSDKENEDEEEVEKEEEKENSDSNVETKESEKSDHSDKENENEKSNSEDEEKENVKSDGEKEGEKSDHSEEGNEDEEKENGYLIREREAESEKSDDEQKEDPQSGEENHNSEAEADEAHREEENENEDDGKKLTDDSDSFDAESEGEKRDENNESFEAEKEGDANDSFEQESGEEKNEEPNANDSFEQEEKANDSFAAEERESSFDEDGFDGSDAKENENENENVKEEEEEKGKEDDDDFGDDFE